MPTINIEIRGDNYGMAEKAGQTNRSKTRYAQKPHYFVLGKWQDRDHDYKSKEVKRMAEKMITLGKKNTLHTKRQALAYITKREVVSKLFDEIAPKYATETADTQNNQVGPRRGDAAEISILELV